MHSHIIIIVIIIISSSSQSINQSINQGGAPDDDSPVEFDDFENGDFEMVRVLKKPGIRTYNTILVHQGGDGVSGSDEELDSKVVYQ